MTAGSLRCALVALVRGRVLSVTGEGLGGVAVTVPEHPEWGSTSTQGDGQFDLVVEAGQHTLDFRRAGHFPAQRLVTLAPAQWGHSPDVTLKKADRRVTEIVPMQGGMHASSPQVDKDGTRTIWLYFPPGTQTSLRFADGSTQAAATVHVRATEYTVGPDGERTMPASLPPTSNYGFAAEFSVDEAVAAGAEGVEFSQPVSFFVDNFLKLPPGAMVPLGSYDRKEARWVADNDARVVTLLSVSGGKADFDIDGDGKADVVPGATAAELIEVAKTFAVGVQLWRGSVSHFSPKDLNYGETCIGGCDIPFVNPATNDNVPNSCHGAGSDIDCHNQTLGEAFAVTGTAFTLRYQSDRSFKPGQGAPFNLDIPWIGGTAPLKGETINAQLDVEIAGKAWSKVRSGKPLAGESEAFTWDGKDAYGRTPQGPMPVTVTLGYRHRSVRGRATLANFNFLEAGGDSFTAGVDGRGGVVVRSTWSGHLGTWYSDAAGLGGLSLSILHQYVPSQGLLYRGDGALVQGDALGATLETRVGGGQSSLEDVPGTEAYLFLPTRLAAGPDGVVYFNDGSRYVRRLALDGSVRTVAGAGAQGMKADGILATEARFTDISGLAVDRQGNLYIADQTEQRIYRVDTSGIVRPFAGTGESGYTGDGGDPLKATLKGPAGLAVSPEGDIYFQSYTDKFTVLRRVRDGVISTVAGGGDQTDTTLDSIPALQARLETSSESGLAYGPDGSVYFSEPFNETVRRLGPDGRIHPVAGTGDRGSTGDRGPALSARLYHPTGIAVRGDGSVYICDASNERLRRVRPDGTIETVAGNGTWGTQGVAYLGSSALRTGLNTPSGVLALADGIVALAERAGGRLSFIKPLQTRLGGANTLLLPSEDGAELYVFTEGGRHLKTLDTLMGTLKHEFKYSPQGGLASVSDALGNTTEVLRDALGRPSGLKSPDGLVTTLKLDAEGRATSVINPANEETKLAYGSDGLLSSLTDARGNASQFEFDSSGRLKKDSNAAGGKQSLVRAVAKGVTSVSVTTALGRTTRYDRQPFGSAADTRSNTAPDGTVSTYVRNADGSRDWVSSDPSSFHTQLAADSRFGMAAPLFESVVTTMPSGLQRTAGTTRTVTLANPADVLSATKVEDVSTVNGKVWKRTWDTASRTLTMTTPLGRQSSARFDANGLLVETADPGVLPVTGLRDARGRLTSLAQGSGAAIRTATLSYNPQGYMAEMIDTLGRKSSFVYDAAGRVKEQTLEGARMVGYGYDGKGNLTSLTPPGRPSHIFAYTPVDLEGEYTPPAIGLAMPQTQYRYNLDQDIIGITRPDGRAISLAYDAGGRPSTLTTPRARRPTLTRLRAAGSPRSPPPMPSSTMPTMGRCSWTKRGAARSQDR